MLNFLFGGLYECVTKICIATCQPQLVEIGAGGIHFVPDNKGIEVTYNDFALEFSPREQEDGRPCVLEDI